MDDRLARIAASGRGLVLLRQARGAGVTDAAVRWAVGSGHLVRVGPGAFVTADVWHGADARRRHLLVLRAALARHPGAVAVAESAAVVWGLPLPDGPPDRPVVLRPRSSARPEHGRRGAVTVRRAWVSEAEHTVVDGVPTTTPGRTFVDLSRSLPPSWSLAVADAVRRSTGCSRGALLEAVDRYPTASGHARARRSALASTHLAESALESLARSVQMELGLPVPVVQAWIGGERPEFRVDMLVAEHATVVEADGRLKYEGPTARPGELWAEKRRTDRLLDLGYDTHRFVYADLHHPRRWGRSLLQVFARSARRRGLPAPRLSYPWA